MTSFFSISNTRGLSASVEVQSSSSAASKIKKNVWASIWEAKLPDGTTKTLNVTLYNAKKNTSDKQKSQTETTYIQVDDTSVTRERNLTLMDRKKPIYTISSECFRDLGENLTVTADKIDKKWTESVSSFLTTMYKKEPKQGFVTSLFSREPEIPEVSLFDFDDKDCVILETKKSKSSSKEEILPSSTPTASSSSSSAATPITAKLDSSRTPSGSSLTTEKPTAPVLTPNTKKCPEYIGVLVTATLVVTFATHYFFANIAHTFCSLYNK